jgi:hypothetical protein
MLVRCYCPVAPSFRLYGGRGIKVCRRWHTFENFKAEMGERPAGLSLDRILNDGNYEPGNCRWANRSTQANNSRHVKASEKKRHTFAPLGKRPIITLPAGPITSISIRREREALIKTNSLAQGAG